MDDEIVNSSSVTNEPLWWETLIMVKVVYGKPLLFSQFCCEPKTPLKSKVFKIIIGIREE